MRLHCKRCPVMVVPPVESSPDAVDTDSMTDFFRLPSPAMVIALLALVVATAGSADATGVISVSSAHVTHKKTKHKKTKKKPAPRLLRGPAGPQGLSGPQGSPGQAGASGQTGAAGSAGLQGGTGQTGQTGQTGATGIGPAYGAFRDGFVGIESTNSKTPTVIATLKNLPAGSYSISAKTSVETSDKHDHLVLCKLAAGGDFDEASAELGEEAGKGDVKRATLPMQVLHTFATTGEAQVTCYATESAFFIGTIMTKIQALRVSSITNGAVTG